MDGRRNNKGTKGNKGGRKPKAEEIELVKLGTDAIVKEYGSVELYWQYIAFKSKESFPHMKMLQEYVYGKPKEKIDLTTTTPPTITLNLNEGD